MYLVYFGAKDCWINLSQVVNVYAEAGRSDPQRTDLVVRMLDGRELRFEDKAAEELRLALNSATLQAWLKGKKGE